MQSASGNLRFKNFIIFLQKGYSDVSLKEIVYEVGFTKGVFYQYFKGKEKLFTEVIDYFFSG